MIDKPLYGNPLAGGLSFRQEGDMGRYVADNDPGGIAAGFSNLEDFLAAGNKIPENRKNPYGTEFIGIGADQTNLFGYKVPDYVIKEQEERMKNNPINVSGVLPGSGSLTPLNPVSGAQQATPPRVDDMRDKTLPTLMFAEGTGPLQPSPPSIFPFPGMDSTEVASAETNPYDRVGQQLTGPGFNQSNDILETLRNIEQGIASLGQGNMNKLSFGGFNNNFGVGSFFPPYGGMYG